MPAESDEEESEGSEFSEYDDSEDGEEEDEDDEPDPRTAEEIARDRHIEELLKAEREREAVHHGGWYAWVRADRGDSAKEEL